MNHVMYECTMCKVGLNISGVVDGVITNDGDAFLYGASKVYRNLSLGDKEPSIELYDRDLVNDRLRLTREHLITFGILVGCDYMTRGVPGIGKENALRFLRIVKKPLHLFNQAHKLLNDSTHCALCKHNGANHAERGCSQCKSSRGCNINSVTLCSCTEHTKLHSNNHQIVFTLERCTQLEDFPFKPVVKEFIDSRQKTDHLAQKLRYTCLSAQKFKAFASLVYMWDDSYCLQQAMNIAVTFRWNFKSCIEAHGSKSSECICDSLRPERIIKFRKKNYENCLEVQWSCPDNFRNVFETLNLSDGCKELRTVESIELLKKFYPGLVAEFESGQSEKRPRKKKSSKVEAESEFNKENEMMCIIESEDYRNEKLNDSLKFLNLESPSKMRKTLGKIDDILNNTPKQVQISKKVADVQDARAHKQVKCKEFVKDKNYVESNQNTLKRLWCPSPSGDQSSSQPVRSAPRITSTPYRTLMSPASFFQKRMLGDGQITGKLPGIVCSPIKEKLHHDLVDFRMQQLQTVPSPYLNVEERQRKIVRIPVKHPSAHVQKKLVVAREEKKVSNKKVNKLIDSDSDRDCSSDSSDVEVIEGPMSREREYEQKQDAKRSRDVAHKLVLDDSDEEDQGARATKDTVSKETEIQEKQNVNPANGFQAGKNDPYFREVQLTQFNSNENVDFGVRSAAIGAVERKVPDDRKNAERKREDDDDDDDDDIVCLEDIPLMERLKLRKATGQC